MVTGGISLFKRSSSQDRESTPPLVLRAIRVAQDLFSSRGVRKEATYVKPVTADVGSFVGNMIFTGRTFMDAGPLNTVMGMFSSLSLLNGFWSYNKGVKEGVESTYCHDQVGVVTSNLGKLEGITRSLFGAAFVTSFLSGLYLNIQSLRLDPKMPNIPPLVNRIVTYAGIAGEGIEIISLGALGISSLVKLSEVAHVGMKLNQEGKADDERAELIQQTFTFDVKKWLKLKRNTPGFQSKLEKEALKALAKAFKQENEKVGEERRISKLEAYSLYTQLFKDPLFAQEYRNQLLQALKLPAKEMNNFSLLALFGLFEQANQHEMKKGKKALRLLNGSTMQEIKKIKTMGLIERLQLKAPSEIQKIAKAELLSVSTKVNRDLIESMASLLLTFSMAALGIAICSLSMLSLVGLSIAPPFWLVLVFIAVMVVVDVTPLKNALYSGRPGRADYLLLAIQALVVITSFSMGIGIAVALHQSASALIKPALIAGSTLALSGFSYHRLHEREREWQKERPQLEDLENLFNQETEGEVPKEISSLFKNLPKEDREAVCQQLKKTSFVQDRYKCGLGVSFLNEIDREEDYERYVRGVKKAVKKCWREYQLKETEKNYQNALSLQTMLDLLRERRKEEALSQLQSLSSHLQREIASSAEKVFKKEESVKNLRGAIQRVLEGRKKYKI